MICFKLKRLIFVSHIFCKVLLSFIALKMLPASIKSKIIGKQKLPKEYGPVLLRETLENLGGMFIKLGQILAMRFDYLPAPYCLELFKLLDNVPPFDTETARNIIREELGKGVNDFTKSFVPQPIASASFGQVYQATLLNNERVIIKVQRPKIEQLVKTDLLFLSILIKLIDLSTILGKIVLSPLFHELKESTLEEIDYRKEARNAIRFYEICRKSGTSVSPRVHTQYSTKRVLTMERLEGIWMNEFLKDLENNPNHTKTDLGKINTDIIARNLLHNVLQQVFEVGYFHADPHPANLLILPGGAIGYIDFGIVGNMPQDFQTKMLNYFLALGKRDIQLAYKHFIDIIQPYPSKDLIQIEKEFKANVTTWFNTLEIQESDISQKSSLRLLLRNINIIRKHNLSFPPVVINFYRTLAIIDMLFTKISPQLDILNEMRDILIETVIKKHIIHEQPEKIIQLLISYHQQIHTFPDKLNDIMNVIENQHSRESRTANTSHLIYNFPQYLSWLSVLVLMGIVIFNNQHILIGWFRNLYLNKVAFYAYLLSLFLVFQWIHRLLSRRL